MSEAEVKKVLLVRAVEEEDASLAPPEVWVGSWHAAGAREDLGAWLVRRASYVLERLPEAPRRLLDFELPPPDLSLVLWIAAAIIGLASNLLSLGHQIHALANPVTALVLWNLAIYAVMIARALGARARDVHASDSKPEEASWDGAIQPLLALIARGSVLWSRLRGGHEVAVSAPGAGSRLRRRFVSDYGRACSPVVLARCASVVHIAAIAFALGALAGIYLQGIAFEYRVGWGSTLVESAAMRARIAALLFLPARIALGASFPGEADLALAATPEGAPAAVWFHVFAITVLCMVVVPRSVLAFIASTRARRLGRSLALPLGDPYWRALAERPAPRIAGGLEKPVTSHFVLDADSCTVLASLQGELVADDIRATPASQRFDALARKKSWYERWRSLVGRGFMAFPDPERPALVDPQSTTFKAPLERLRSSENPFARELVLLELAAFEAYWPLEPGELRLFDRIGLAPSLQRSVRRTALEGAAELLSLPLAEGAELRRLLGATTRELSGVWPKVFVGAAAGTALGALTLGIAAPFAAGLLGKAVGAASLLALKAGLAAIGGGTIVAAGAGAAGGGVLVGGGALLALGRVAPGNASGGILTPATALLSSAKIEIFLRHVVAGRHQDAETFHKVLLELRASVDRLREELPAFRLDPSQNTRQIREREKVIEILERVATRNEEWSTRHEHV